MKQSDLFNELIGIPDPEQRATRIAEIAESNPELAAKLISMLENYTPNETFLEESIPEIISKPQYEEIGEKIRRIEAPNQQTTNTPIVSNRPSPDVTKTPHTIAGYEILSPIGFGGSAMVYRAFDPSIEKTVALKVLHSAQGNTDVAIARLQKEARAMGRIKHPNVVEVYRVEIQPIPFIAMEYVEGQSLESFLNRNGKLSLAAFSQIAIQILKGIQAAHDQGLIHRDPKPANILLTNTEPPVAKITDFGIVRRENDKRETLHGSVVGTPRYMSPEQADDKVITARSDLFSLGSVFYEMLCGESPFKAESHLSEMKAVLRKKPASMRLFRSDIPSKLEWVIRKMLDKKANKRFKSATEILNALQSLQLEQTQQLRTLMPMPLQGSWTSTRAFAAVCAIAAGLLLLVILLNKSPSPKIQSLQPDISAVQRIEDKKQNNFDTVDSKAEVPQSIAEKPVEPIDHPWIQELRIPFSAGVAKEYQQRWADALGIAVEVQNQFGMPFVLIPPGEFIMGYTKNAEFTSALLNAKGDAEREIILSASRPTLIQISFPFYISKYEISEAERFRVLLSDHSGPSVLDLENSPSPPRKRDEDRPVTKIPWDETISFCQRLNELTGLCSSPHPITREQLGFGCYRLPTESEWEWAGRAGREGKGIADPKEFENEVWAVENPERSVHPRGLKQPNPFGLHDMLGNAQEWCLDNFAPEYFAGNTQDEPVLVNPLATTDHAHFKKGHILRGGALIFDRKINSFTSRQYRDEYSTSWFTGFRIVIPIAPEAIEKCKLDL
jgi:serine/threonine protein kinase